MTNQKHSPLPWYIDSNKIVRSGHGKESIAVAYASKEDGELIVSSVNNTFSKDRTCLNCRHWRDKSWTEKGWGICDNPKNEVYIGTAIVGAYVKDPTEQEELKTMVENGIRYPEDFGCIFFEAIEK